MAEGPGPSAMLFFFAASPKNRMAVQALKFKEKRGRKKKVEKNGKRWNKMEKFLYLCHCV